MKRCKVSRGLTERILSIFCPNEIAVPKVLVLVAKGSEESANVLYFTFRLSVGLGVISGSETNCDIE